MAEYVIKLCSLAAQSGWNSPSLLAVREELHPTLQAELACRNTNTSLSQYITMTIHLVNLLHQQCTDGPPPSFQYHEKTIATREERAEAMQLGRTRVSQKE